MRTWVKATVGGFALLAVGLLALAGTGAYFVLRNLERQQTAEAESVKAIEAVKARFVGRTPLLEIIDPRRADIRINRPAEASSSPVDTVHVINWKSDTGELTRAELPLWLMRFSSINILSQLGIAPDRFRLTVSDVERYGPGIIVDYGAPGSFRTLVWVD
jgi:hypothetical protein